MAEDVGVLNNTGEEATTRHGAEVFLNIIVVRATMENALHVRSVDGLDI